MYFHFPTRTHTVVRNGLTFQIPCSNHCSARFTVHPDGSGTGWDESSPDVDQPHGLDYRSHQDIRKGVRKRLAKEHETCADATAGGEHLPGGCRILGIVENTTDLSTGYGDASYDVTTGKFIGRGLVYDQSNNAFWCATNSDGTTSGDPYLLKIHPDRGWDGGDVTWAGGHEFDASVDFTGTVTFDGTAVVNADTTYVNFGKSAGIGLFYDPTAFAGGETNTLGNAQIIKAGHKATPSGDVVSGSVDVSFGTPFPNGILSAVATLRNDTQINVFHSVDSVATTGFTFYYAEAGAAVQACDGFDWIAIGY